MESATGSSCDQGLAVACIDSDQSLTVNGRCGMGLIEPWLLKVKHVYTEKERDHSDNTQTQTFLPGLLKIPILANCVSANQSLLIVSAQTNPYCLCQYKPILNNCLSTNQSVKNEKRTTGLKHSR